MTRIKHPPGYRLSNQYHIDQLAKKGLIVCPMWVSPTEHNTIASMAAIEGVTLVELVTKLFTDGLNKL